MTSSAKAEPQGSEPSLTDGPRCGECGEPIHFPARTMEAVQRWEHVGHSGHAAVPPKPVLFEKYEEPEPRPCTCGPDEACGDPCTPATRSADLPCLCGHRQDGHVSFEKGGCMGCTCSSFRLAPEEPPLTPEEEEEAPEDSQCTCGQTACESELCACDCAPCPVDHASEELPPPEGPEYTPCVCGHIEPEHSAALFRTCNKCGCLRYRPESEPPPPQPERRAPYVATYSVGGHLYEVAVPGDACLQAVDGALVIRHGLGPVAGLVGFQPLTVEEKA